MNFFLCKSGLMGCDFGDFIGELGFLSGCGF